MKLIAIGIIPVEVRYTVLSLGFNTAASIFAGSAILICAQLAHWSPNHLLPALYLMLLALLPLTVLALLFYIRRLSPSREA